MIITKKNNYEGEFCSVEVKEDENGELILTIYGKYRSGYQYLILGEKKKITEQEYLEFVKKELETIKFLINKDYGKQD
ncbi:MAG TPA: hypothetical protein PLL26_05220 [Candidatus Dojkabacteria bacterium]|nr:hypothetical protein [Candidatus Dojkabacteria bacterium]